MKKLFSLVAVSSLLLSLGCSKSDVDQSFGDSEVTTNQTITLTASVAPQSTKTVTDGAGTYVNRCVMEIYYDNTLIKREFQEVTDYAASFTVQIPTNRTYKIAFWADYVAFAGAEPTTAELQSNSYYDVSSLTAVSFNGTYLGNNDKRDAFFYCGDYEVKQGTTPLVATLKRPFAQLNVSTTDIQALKDISTTTIPTNVDVTLKQTYTTLNLLTGDLSDAQDLNYNAAFYDYPSSIGTETSAKLSMDYVFAATDKAALDITWKAVNSTSSEDITYAFTNIPYQRNYRTNIKGSLLTATRTWDVSIDKDWDDPDYDEDVCFQVNSKQYVALEDALEDVTSGNVIKVLKDVDYTSKYTSVSSHLFDLNGATLDLQGFTITANNQSIMFAGNNSTIENGTFASADNGYALSIGTTSATSGFSVSDVVCTGGIKVSNTAVTISDATVAGNSYAVFGDDNSTITIDGGTYSSVASSGCSVISNNGSTSASIEILDGTISGSTDVSIIETGSTVSLKGGTYNQNPASFLATGYVAKEESGLWTVSLADLKIEADGEETVYATMATFRDNVNSGTSYSGYTVTLLKDVDLTDWTPIGTNTGEYFEGTFDGGSHTISLTQTEIDGEFGLFLILEKATVKSLNLDVNLTVKSGVKSQIGGLTCEALTSNSFTDIVVTGSIVTGQYGGGLVGYNANGTATFTNCTNKASITANIPSSASCSVVGGISAQAKGKSVTFTSCRNEGQLTVDHTNNTSSPSYMGHITGRGNNTGTNAITMTSCSFKEGLVIRGWNVQSSDCGSTYPFEGVMVPTETNTYTGTPNSGKLLIGGYFMSCTIDEVACSGTYYPNGN